MHFCRFCNNMYYIKISDKSPNELAYYCRKCGDNNDTLTVDSVSISKINVKNKGDDHHFSNVINPFTKLDPTLPRINHIACPNTSCTTNTEDKEREIIYIRYDDANIKYAYLCSTCDTAWKL